MTVQLYMIATPLGNLGDITLRALEMLRCLDVFFAEDSREFSKLLEALQISTDGKRIYSYASHNLKEATEKAIEILKSGKSVGLVTDRGTPAISDPGALVAARAHEEGIPVIPIPGPSSVSALLSVSGLQSTAFEFAGFLPQTDKHRHQLLDSVEARQMPLVFFESPKRIRATLLELKSKFPNGRVFIGREMTKKFEEYRWLDLKTFNETDVPELGEYAVLVEAGTEPKENIAWDKEVHLRLASDKEWAKDIAQKYGVASSDIYNALQQLKKK